MHYNIPKLTNDFRADAATYAASLSIYYTDGDTATWVGDTNNNTFNYLKSLWFYDIDASYTEVAAGLASTFRETVNNDFSIMESETDNVNDNLTVLRNALAKVATSSSTADLTTTTERQFATQTEKDFWNRKIYVDTPESPSKIYQGSTEITQGVKNLLNLTIPSKTSDLTNDSNFLVGTGYTKNNIVYNLGVSLTSSSESPLETGSVFKYKMEYSLPGCNANMTPIVVLTASDSVSGNYAQVAESGANCVYIWSKINSGTTIPLIYAITPDEITSA